MVRYRVLDLFSGIGGFSLGLERAGMKTVAFCEIDPFCRKVLAKHWPDVPCHDDITTREFVEGEADVITGGFPCQDISFAGAGAGLSGARSGLYRHLIRAIRLVRPRYAIMENVAALLSRGLGTVLGDLAEIGNDAEWHCIPASAVGAPHRRDRVWIIANARSVEHESDSSPLSGTLAEELSGASVADAECSRAAQPAGSQCEERLGVIVGGENVAYAAVFGSQGSGQPFEPGNPAPDSDWQAGEPVDGRLGYQWATEPDVGRVAHGVPARVDRLRSLGNAVVPQIPEIIGRAIMERA